jgi:hypothetical protein
MPNADRAAKLSASLAKGFGEDFTFTPRTIAGNDVDLPRVPDPTRAQFTVTGLWTGGSRERHPNARGHAADLAQGAVSAGPRAGVEIAALAWQPGEGDLCLRVETGDTYAVGRFVPDGFGRATIYLTARKRQ